MPLVPRWNFSRAEIVSTFVYYSTEEINTQLKIGSTQYERVWEGSLTRFVRENCRRPRYQDRNDNCFTEGHEVAKADFDAMYAYMYDPLDSAFTGYYRKRWFRAVIQDILELEEMKLEHARRFST